MNVDLSKTKVLIEEADALSVIIATGIINAKKK
jgi:hypothetical protein